MNLPPNLLNNSAKVLTRTGGTVNRLREVQGATWAAGASIPCGIFPVSKSGQDRAGLLRLTVDKEIYLALEGTLHTIQNRLEVDGTCYSLENVQEWPGFIVCLVRAIPCG